MTRTTAAQRLAAIEAWQSSPEFAELAQRQAEERAANRMYQRQRYKPGPRKPLCRFRRKA